MTYREKLQKYKSRELSERENQELAADIEKQEAISEYLTEQLEEEMGLACEEAGDYKEEDQKRKELSQEKEFETYVKKSIRRSFRKMALAVCGILLAVVLFIQFGLSPLISKFYYDPSKVIRVSYDGGESEVLSNQMSRDLAVYSELKLPGKRRDSVNAVPLGYGTYNIVLNQTVVYGGMRRYGIGGQIKRGRLELYDPDYLTCPFNNIFANYGLEADSGLSYEEQMEKQKEEGYSTWYYGDLETGRQQIEDLEEHKKYRAYVTLKKTMDFSQMNALIKRMHTGGMTGAAELWQGVCVGNSNTSALPLLGYNYEAMLSREVLTKEEAARYPELSLAVIDKEGNMDWEATDAKREDEAVMKKHFQSMLQYLADRPQFMQMMGEAQMEFRGKEGLEMIQRNYSAYMDYVEKNGLTYYGLVCIADKEGMEKMLEDKDILAVVAMETE